MALDKRTHPDKIKFSDGELVAIQINHPVYPALNYTIRPPDSRSTDPVTAESG
jgi:hypothetical protein